MHFIEPFKEKSWTNDADIGSGQNDLHIIIIANMNHHSWVEEPETDVQELNSKVTPTKNGS